MKKSVKAFTLAETLIVVVMLGIIAAITIPTLVKNNIEIQNRTRLKKAMVSYEKAINTIVFENDLKSDTLLQSFGDKVNCTDTTTYFKKAQNIDGCKFKTSDGVWWDITDIERPIISFKQTDLDSDKANTASDKRAFVMVGRIDDATGILRVNDLGYESVKGNSKKDSNGYESKAQVEKLYLFAKIADTRSEFMKNCIPVDETYCRIDGVPYEKVTLTAQSVTGTGVNNANGNNICIYDRETSTRICDGTYESKTNAGDIAYFADMGTLTETEARDCTGSVYTACSSYGDYYEAAKRKCTNGTHLATPAELKALKDIGRLSSGLYWTSSETNYGSANRFDAETGGVNSNTKKTSTYSVICVGN